MFLFSRSQKTTRQNETKMLGDATLRRLLEGRLPWRTARPAFGAVACAVLFRYSSMCTSAKQIGFG